MNYGKIKELLNSANFKLKYTQTDIVLDLLMFENDKIDGSVVISFGDVELPDDIINSEFNYETAEFLNELMVNDITFNIDKGIQYSSVDVFSADGVDENHIYIQGDDIKYFSLILEILTNQDTIIDAICKHNNQVNSFLTNIKPFVSILQQHGINKFTLNRENSTQNTVIGNIHVAVFNKYGMCVYFTLNWLSGKISILPQLTIDVEVEGDLSWDLTEFEECVKTQSDAHNKLKKRCI